MKLANFIYPNNCIMPLFVFLLALSVSSCGSEGAASPQNITTNATGIDLPLIYIEDFDYQGGFRIKQGTFGSSKTSYSKGRIGYNSASDTMFISGKSGDAAIAEFAIPTLVKSSKYADLPITGDPMQNFRVVIHSADTGNVQGINRIGAIHYDQSELLVHAYTSYDADEANTYTSLMVRDATNLAGSNIDGFFEFNGAAHLVNWISPLDAYWQIVFGKDLISGGATAMSIHARLSMGPSLFIHDSADLFGLTNTSGPISATPLMDFNLNRVFANNAKGWTPSETWDQNNLNGDNDFFTDQDAGGYYGQIMPGTRTYAVFGAMGMAWSGGGYKITQKGGTATNGPVPRHGADRNTNYWFFDVNDILEVKNGNKQPHEVKPYSYGVFPMPFNITDIIGGGTYDSVNDLLYFSLIDRDKAQNQFEPTPVIIAYSYSKKGDYSHLLTENFYKLSTRVFKWIDTGPNSAGQPDWSTSQETKIFNIGDTAHISWRSVGFDNCVASDGAWSGDLSKVGFKEIKITSPGQNFYEITCSNTRTGHTLTRDISLSISN